MNACWSIVIGLLAVAAGVLAALPYLVGEDTFRKWLAALGLLVLIVSVAIKTGLEIRTLERTASFRQFDREKLPKIDEASGAALLNGKLYVVHDEESKLFELNIDDDVAFREKEIELNPCPGAVLTEGITADDVRKATELEDVAPYKNRLLLLSSHALSRKEAEKRDPVLPNKRALLMEMDMQAPTGPCIARATSLRKLLPLSKDANKANMEGLAVTDQGTMYIGFRSPLVDGGALIMEMNVDAAFNGNPQPRLIALELKHDEGEYAITALAVDGTDILVLGNGATKEDILTPRLWRWKPTTAPFQRPYKRTAWDYGVPKYANAKAEGIAADREYAWVVLDAPRWGGVRRFPRSAIQ